jgi:iron complex transport system permease protein
LKTYFHSTALLIWIIALIGFNLRDYATTDPWLLAEFRIPRISGSLLTGFGLALSGLLMQTLFRNPLAGPFLMGVTPGASLGMAVYIFAGSALGTSYSFLGSTTSSVIGAFAALAIQLSLSRGFSSPLRLLLVGMVMGFVFSAGVELLQQFGNEQEIQRFTFWGMGSFDQIKSGDWIYLLTPVGLVAALTWWLRHPLDAYLLGDLYAQGSGISLKKLRIFLIFGGALLAGWITSFAGPIGFIGLVAPHIAKRLIRSESHSRVLIPALLWGGALCLSADTLAHNLLTDLVLPLNPISALIGAPILLYGLLRTKTI